MALVSSVETMSAPMMATRKMTAEAIMPLVSRSSGHSC